MQAAPVVRVRKPIVRAVVTRPRVLAGAKRSAEMANELATDVLLDAVRVTLLSLGWAASVVEKLAPVVTIPLVVVIMTLAHLATSAIEKRVSA